MKKFILLLAFVSVLNMQTKAQQSVSLTEKENYTTVKSYLQVQDNMILENKPAPGNNNYDKDYNYYNRKSRNQRITGLSLLGGGLLLGVAGLLVASSNSNSYQSNGQTAVALFIVSAAAGLTSIPFMILAHVNKTKARATLSTQKTFIPGKGNNYTTGLTVSMPIGR